MASATLTVITCNIRGITSQRKQLLLRKWLENYPHDALLLQELHMTTQEQLLIFQRNFQEYQVICSLGTWSSGGAMVMIKNRITVVDVGTDQDGRVAFGKISINGCPMAIVSVYAPAQIRERQSFFNDLHLFIPSAKWMLIGGDFNCAPDLKKDRNQYHDQTDKRSYASLDRNFIRPLCLTELFRFRHPRKIVYSYHSDQQNIHSRIDFFFGTEFVKKNTQQVEYVPLAISDHDALTITLSTPTATAVEYRRWICNPLVARRTTFLPRFRKIWDVLHQTADFDSLEWWTDLKVSLTLLLQDEQGQMVREGRKEVRELQRQYRKLSVNPSQEHLERLISLRTELRRLLEEKVATNTRWQQERSPGALNTLARTALFNRQAQRATIPFLDHPTRGRITTDHGMLEIATAFYRELYQRKPCDESAWQEIFDGTPMLSQQDRLILDQDLTVAECHEALRTMAAGRSPGDDGITVEVWRVIFPIIGEYYVRMANIAKANGHFIPGFLNALLTLLKKDGTADGPIKSYRPLSLMNTDYKILSKVLNNRLRKSIASIVHQDQTCAIPGRSIQDNIHLIRSIIEHQARTKDPLGIILWDQEKAFDRINHRYLFAALKAFGFGQGFVDWVALLYANGAFRIRVNGSISSPIAFQCGVRQGCSLSGSLFVICLEPLLHRIRQNPRIPGLIPPGGQIDAVRRIIFTGKNVTENDVRIKATAYADDINTMVFNQEEEEETMRMFDLYNRASGGRTNAEKTELLWICEWLPPPRFLTKTRQDSCVFLGVPIDTKGQLPQAAWNQKVQNIKQQMNLWSRLHLSMGERCLVLKLFILSGIVYWLSLMTISNDHLQEIHKMTITFFWANKRPKVFYRTLIGRKQDGGYGLPHVQSMIDAYRTKCGLQIISARKTATWKFFALINVASKLRRFVPHLWSNMTPHLDHGNTLCHETAQATSRWLLDGGKMELPTPGKSIYWQIIGKRWFVPPVCKKREKHLDQVPLFQILHTSSLPAVVLDLWYLISNYAVNTRARIGTDERQRQCYYCNQPETISHLFLHCSSTNRCFQHLNTRIVSLTGATIGRADRELIYLRNILDITSNKRHRTTIVNMIGYYLHTIWQCRNHMRSATGRNDSANALIIFKSVTAHLPFDNG